MDAVLKATVSLPRNDSESERRSGNFPPSIWEDFLQALADSDDYTEENMSHEEQDEHARLKEIVRKMLMNEVDDDNEIDHGCKSNGRPEKLDLIDTIQRLGVAYHYESEIQALLLSVQFMEEDGHGDNLHEVALCFRLLRQLGHFISCDVFNQFKDEEGNFKESLTKDVRGLLSFYEAANYRVHDEDILEEAMDFTTSQHVSISQTLDGFWASRVKQALAMPIQKTLNRVGARRFISLYQQDTSRDAVLLKFAKLDYNILQSEYRKELRILAKWWKSLDTEANFPFARERVVECYLWSVGVYFEPKYSLARISLAKICCITSIVDDIYDTYGLLKELILFTDAIERWDISASHQLPPYMRHCYRALLDVYIEIEERLAKEEKSDLVAYAISSMKDLVRSYFEEAKWIHSGHVPNFEEYMKVALVICTYEMLSMNSLVCMRDFVTEDALDWIEERPMIIRSSTVICRLMDDMIDYESGKDKGELASAVDCYMNQYDTSKEETFTVFERQLSNAWKHINKGCLNLTPTIPMFIRERILNFSRIMYLLFRGNDGYTNPSAEDKDLIKSLLIDPVPLMV